VRNILFASMLLISCAAVAGAETGRARIDETPVRAEANLDGTVIATLKEGAAVEVIDVQGDYYRVLVPGDAGKPMAGYVLARLVELDDVDGSSNEVAIPDAGSEVHHVTQGEPIPPTLVQLGLPKVKEFQKKRVAGASDAARQLLAEEKALKREEAAERKAMEREMAAERKAMARELAAEQRELAAEKKATERRQAAEREANKRVEAAKAERDRLNAVVEKLKAQTPDGARQE